MEARTQEIARELLTLLLYCIPHLSPTRTVSSSVHTMTNLFIQEAKEFEMLLDNTANIVHKLKESNKEFGSVTTDSSAMKEIKECMEKDMDAVGKMAHMMEEKLREIIRSNVESRMNPGCGIGTAIVDISRMPLTIALKAKLNERKSDLENLGKTIRQEYLEIIQRRNFTVTGIKLSDEAIREIDIGSVVQMFENALPGISAEQMLAAVDVIKERHAVATDLGKKIFEVQKIFERMIELIEEDDKALDNALDEELSIEENDLQGINQEQVISSAVDEIKEWHATDMDVDDKILELQQNFEATAALVKTQPEIIKKPLSQVENVVIHARSKFDELRDLLDDNDNDSICQCL